MVGPFRKERLSINDTAQQYMEVNTTSFKNILHPAASIDQTSSQMLHDLIEYVNAHGLVEPGYTDRM